MDNPGNEECPICTQYKVASLERLFEDAQQGEFLSHFRACTESKGGVGGGSTGVYRRRPTSSSSSFVARVQQEQRLQYGVKNPRPILVITPTYARTFQALHLTGLLHSLMLVPHPLTWLVVEAGDLSNETSAILSSSLVPVLHLPFREQISVVWSDRHRLEARMRLYALKVIRERRLDGIVLFADDSNVHTMELFDEIQKVEWMGAVSVGILAHSAAPETSSRKQQREGEKELSHLPIQGPACNSSGHLIGWHTFNTLPYAKKAAIFVGEGVTVLPSKLEWSGFVINSRLLWKEAEGKPNWVRDLDDVGINGEEIESPLDLLKDATSVEPLGNCGKKVLLWWLRAEARYDSKFPTSDSMCRTLLRSQTEELCKPVEVEEIRAALHDVGNGKAPGPDGYGSKFFLSAWDIIGND
ncbi:putative beta-1,4-xylosyltransferase IRX14 [Curcuma longa]|uniref:putative beta-1,4-xylosyltransferase IRX14 n=1 Tax=Curcuma longa TaxID=136217 RepID=UPI003D9EBF35